MQNCKKVSLRVRRCKNGMLSYYLQYYPAYRDFKTMKTMTKESLGIYVYADPQNARELNYNREMREKAEVIRCRRFEQIINQRYSLFDKNHLRESFLEYFEQQTLRHTEKWYYVYRHFREYVGGKCAFGEVSIDLCRGFCDYLLFEAKSFNNGEPLSNNSIASYWSTFRAVLRIAYKSKQIPENLNDYLDRVEYEETIKESLTLQEIYKLYQTDCSIDVLKRAALFSCLTGLRFSDVRELRWEMVKEFADGTSYLDFLAVKTSRMNMVPINEDVLDLMGERDKGRVFKGLYYHMTGRAMKEWLKAAGITKHITFHCFRHTFATLQVELGTDIYTVQSLLGHANVTTTEIYARHDAARSKAASRKLSLELLKNISEASANKRKENSKTENK